MAEYPMYNEIYSNPPTPGANAQQQQYHHHHQDSSSSTSPVGGYPQWETLDPQSLVDNSPMIQDLEEMDTPTPTATSFDFQPHPNPSQMLDEPPHIVPSQGSPVDNAPILLHHPSEVPIHHHRPSPPAHTQMRNYSSGQQHYRTHTPSPLSPVSQLNTPLPPPQSSSSSNTTGPIRSSTRGAARANPYYRPSSNLSGLATPFGMGGPGAVHSFPSSLASSAAPSPNAAGGTPMTRTARKSSQTVRFSDDNLAPPAVRREAAPRTRAQSQTPRSVPSSSPQAAPQAAPRASGSSSSSPPRPTNQSQRPPSSSLPSSSSSSSKTRNQNANPNTQLPPHTARLPLISIPSDITYSAPDCTLVAHLDIPGVSRDALRITLGTCYFNRVRYVCVLGMRGAEGVGTSSSSGGGSEDLYEILGQKRAASKGRASGETETTETAETEQQPPRQEEEEEEGSADDPQPSRRPSRDIKEELAGFGIPQSSTAATEVEDRASTPKPTSQPQVDTRSSTKKNLTSRMVTPNVRERKYGVMRRVFQVPGTTQLKDIDAALNDGVLTLRIHCGAPFEEDDEVDVPVRIG
ncbi:hypothetical protein M413DRAFT_128437 [Hebeloma cylindrosporum]|uniref:SHSP domain-containing protein n=1 Tax=Hebeloma cylindrosporum TaxID=76867 RepID=A0A0C2YME8_HEBCY|nr:hypothetical protein M413DRAFT_128437 [Hebeloma cylindrosporum h7]